MSADYPSELESQIAVRMKNSTLNEVVKRAVKEGLCVEEWILKAVEEKLEMVIASSYLERCWLLKYIGSKFLAQVSADGRK